MQQRSSPRVDTQERGVTCARVDLDLRAHGGSEHPVEVLDTDRGQRGREPVAQAHAVEGEQPSCDDDDRAVGHGTTGCKRAARDRGHAETIDEHPRDDEAGSLLERPAPFERNGMDHARTERGVVGLGIVENDGVRSDEDEHAVDPWRNGPGDDEGAIVDRLAPQWLVRSCKRGTGRRWQRRQLESLVWSRHG